MSNDIQNPALHLSCFIRSFLLTKHNCNHTRRAHLLFPHALTNAQDNPSCSNAVAEILLYLLPLGPCFFLLKTLYQPELKREEHLCRAAYCDYGMIKATDEAMKSSQGKRTCQGACQLREEQKELPRHEETG